MDRLRQYSAAGHLLANHTHSHQRINSLGMIDYRADIRKADAILREMPTLQAVVFVTHFST